MKKWLRRFKENERGLTLVELLAVIVILGIVGAIAFVAIGNVMENSKEDAHISNGLQVISAAELYQTTGGVIPTDAAGSELKASNANFDTIADLIDPWGDNSGYDFKVSLNGSDEIIVTPIWPGETEGTTAVSGCSGWGTGLTKEGLRADRDKICETSN